MDKNDPLKNNSTPSSSFSSSEIRTLEKDIAALKNGQDPEAPAAKIEVAPIVAPVEPLPETPAPVEPAPPIEVTPPPVTPTQTIIAREELNQALPKELFSNPFAKEESMPSDGPRTESLPTLNKEKRSTVNSLHTFSSDVAEAVQNEHTSIATIASAENKRRNDTRRKKEVGTGSQAIKIFLMTVIGLLFLGAGSGAFYYFVFRYSAPPIVTVTPTAKEIITPDDHATFSISDIDRADFIKEIDAELSKSRSDGSIEQILLTRTIAASTTPAEPADLFSLIQTQAPDALVRSFEPSFFFGIHESGTTSEPFLILESNSFPNTIAGMGQWEKTMVSDLQDIFLQPADRLTSPSFTVTASGDSYTFRDGVLDNKNVRIAEDAQGKIVLMYAFLDNSTLVIATDEATLKEIEDRVVKAQFVR